jgi:hypothetical protein
MEATGKGKAEVWQQRMESQRASGQSVRAWCSANGAAEHSFYWWRRKLGFGAGAGGKSPQARRAELPPARQASPPQRQASPPQRQASPPQRKRSSRPVSPAFAQVTFVGPAGAEAKLTAVEGSRSIQPLRLALRSGHELLLPDSMPAEEVARLIRALERPA